MTHKEIQSYIFHSSMIGVWQPDLLLKHWIDGAFFAIVTFSKKMHWIDGAFFAIVTFF